ncbi:CopD family protein [Stutzerimonas azotifigens]|uniref:Copper resistance protein D domain-containing protein n=1 Tax=Stutzerimonas azotifigens TaxID=291995 RepID=A0ABR5YX15_9GAMM|nr:CopD family protein [Stutzerimonas azotifigens]MBA1272447.1 hypothetical protein [Stutzerimonas azotifigens]
MTAFALLYALHALAALVWVGGMFFAWVILRPAAVATLPAPERLTLWADVLRRFLQWVWVAVLLLPLSGIGLWHMRFAGLDGAPRYVHLMAGLYLVMLALFLRISLLHYPLLKTSVAAGTWPQAGAALGQIRRLVGINLLIGIAVFMAATARPMF